MSEKKPKSKSKDKAAEKPPKDTKSKKQKGDDTKSKKSADKQSKKPSKSPSKKEDKLAKSKISKISKAQGQSKIDMDESQNMDDLSFFKPVATQFLFNLDESLCQYHKEKNSIYCEICEQPGCQQCIVYGPHNNQMHRVNKLDQSFKARYLYLNELVCGELIERRDRLNKRLGDLTVMSDELRYVKSGIQKMTKIQYNEMLQRLRTSSGGKFAVLHHEMAQLQKDLESINALAHEFGYLTNMKPQISSIPPNNPSTGMVPFLLRAKYLQQQAEQLISKPIKTSVDVYPYDLPRELTEKKMILDKNKKWVELLQIKDQAIWNLVQQKKSLEKRMWEQFDSDVHTEILQWTKIKQKVEGELREYDMFCQKCRSELNEQKINAECDAGGFHQFC